MNAWWQELWQVLGHPLMLPLAIAAMAGVIAYALSRSAPAISRTVSLVASVAVFVLAIRLLMGEQIAFEWMWLSVDDLKLVCAMTNRSFGTVVALGAGLFGMLSAVYAASAARRGSAEGRFHAFLCWTMAGAMGVGFADDLIWLLICWEVTSVCLYMLLNLGRGESAAGAAKTFCMIGFGDAAMLLSIALILATEHTTHIGELSIAVDSPLTYTCYVLFMLAALVKAGAVPVHSWIPTAATDAPAPVFVLLPASLDKLLGAYLLVRFSLGVFMIDQVMQIVLLIIGAVTVLTASLAAMMQSHAKRLIAFQAIGSTGYIVLGVGTATPIGLAGAVFHAINGAIYQACLFFGVGNVERRAGTSQLDHLGGLAAVLPGTFVATLTAALAISGVPPLNGFVSKWLIYQGCLSDGSPLAMFCLVIAVFGSALTLAASVKLIASVFWGPPSELMPSVEPVSTARDATTVGPALLLAFLCIAFGVAAQWPMGALVLPAISGLGVTGVSPAVQAGELEAGSLGLWGPTPATILLILGVLGGLALYLLNRTGHVRVTSAFQGGEMLGDAAAMRLSATDFYRTVEQLPGIGGAMRDAQRGAMDVYRLGGWYGLGLVNMLKRQHTGVLSLYVSWCLAGLVLIAVYLMTVM